MSFAEAKEEIRQKIGSLEPLECGLDQVRKSVLETVIPVWNSVLNAITTGVPLSLAGIR